MNTLTTEKNTNGDEVEIRQLLDNFSSAFSTKDIKLMMSLFSPDMVSFDIIPPLQYVGNAAYTKVWKETFALFQDPIHIELRDLTITSDTSIAFSYCFLRLTATTKDGHQIDYWERLTCCYKKTNEKWLIVHEHVSLPADLKTGKAVMNLKP